MFRSLIHLRRPGGINAGIHSVRTSKLPVVPWSFDSRYLGKTASEVIEKYKLKSGFPVYSFPSELLSVRVEEIESMAKVMRRKSAMDAMKLLTDKAFNNDSFQVQ